MDVIALRTAHSLLGEAGGRWVHGVVIREFMHDPGDVLEIIDSP